MAGFIVKLIVCPIGILVSDILFGQVYYPYIYQPMVIGIIIAIIGYLMEVALLKKGTLLISTALDFLVATAIIYLGSLLMPGAAVTFIGAVLTGLVVTITEYLQHLWLIKSGRVKFSGQRI